MVRNGTVKRYDDRKGTGFITPDDGTDDIFFHHSSIDSDGFRILNNGESVQYQVAYDSKRRLKAVNVTSQGSTRRGGDRVVGDRYGDRYRGDVDRYGFDVGSSRYRGDEDRYGFDVGGSSRYRGDRDRYGLGGGSRRDVDRYGGGDTGYRRERVGGGRCYTCGEEGHFMRHCPNSYDGKCHECGERGHLASQCKVYGSSSRRMGHDALRHHRSPIRGRRLE